MKSLIGLILFIALNQLTFAQEDTTKVVQDETMCRIVKTDNTELIGTILSRDARELLVLTKDGRKIYIPQYVVKEIIKIESEDFNANGVFIGEDAFATRYFITTNGLPIKKGEHYVQWNLFGPDFQFGIAENLGVGIMTTWISSPVIGTIKYSVELGPNAQLALGGLAGTGSWGAPEWGGALPFAALSFGNRKANIALSAGYGAIWTGNSDGAQGRALASIAGMIKIAPKLSLVFDSFILLPGQSTFRTNTYTNEEFNPMTQEFEPVQYTETFEVKKRAFALLIPGIRWHQSEGKALQFGFTGVYMDDDIVPIPIPMVQWYRSI